jgi:hypothetical protein
VHVRRLSKPLARAAGRWSIEPTSEMLDWLRASRLSPRRVFVTHGEPSAADAMRRRLVEAFGWEAIFYVQSKLHDGTPWPCG